MPSSKLKSQHPNIEIINRTITELNWTPETIAQASIEMLRAMQFRVALGEDWGCIEIPEHFMPEGTLKGKGSRIFRMAQFFSDETVLDSPEANHAWCEILRFVIARRSIKFQRFGMVGYSTISTDLKNLKLITPLLAEQPASNGYFWSRMSEDALLLERSSNIRNGVASVINTVAKLYKIGCLPDKFRSQSKSEGCAPERDRIGESEQEVGVKLDKKWQPLPDKFVSEMGWRSLRIIKIVAPMLLDALDAVKDFEGYARDEAIATWSWQDELGMAIDSKYPWPPTSFSGALSFAHQVIKPAHLWMVLLCNGSRQGEVLSMLEDCLSESADGNHRWQGRTFKMTGVTGGREMDAIVPEIVTQAIMQQTRLARITREYRGYKTTSLWPGRSTAKPTSLNNLLNRYAKVLGQEHLLSEENPSCSEHRFRKTLARVVALALVNSLMILKDCFGHTDPEMTLLRYIMSDPSIAQEVINVQKELTIMMAVDVIANRETVNGSGAEGLRQRADEYLKRIGKSKFEPQDAYEFARRETFDGRAWMMIAPGILCTAPHNVTQVSSPCASNQRRSNPTNCKPGCDWQIVLKSYYVTQADDSVTYAVKNLQRAVDESDSLSTSFWSGQLRTWIYRYDEVAEKWNDHPLIKQFAPRTKKSILEAA